MYLHLSSNSFLRSALNSCAVLGEDFAGRSAGDGGGAGGSDGGPDVEADGVRLDDDGVPDDAGVGSAEIEAGDNEDAASAASAPMRRAGVGVTWALEEEV